MRKRSVILSVGICFGLTSFGMAGTDSFRAFQDLMGGDSEVLSSFEFSEPILLAKKKNNRKNRGKKQPKPVKISAKSLRTISLQDQAEDRLSNLGTPDENEGARRAEQSDAKINRYLTHQAREKNFIQAAQTRVFNGSDINGKDSSGRTLLHAAVLNGFPDAARYLIKSGADVNIKDTSGLTPQDLARTMKLSDLVTILNQKP